MSFTVWILVYTLESWNKIISRSKLGFQWNISLHERTISGEKCSHLHDHNFLFNPNLYNILINVTFEIVLRKYLIISRILDVNILKVLRQKYAITFWSEYIIFNLITFFIKENEVT